MDAEKMTITLDTDDMRTVLASVGSYHSHCTVHTVCG